MYKILDRPKKRRQSFLNTLFLEQDKTNCRVANKWTEVILETFIIKPELVYPSFPVIEERLDPVTVKPPERMKAACLLADFIIKGFLTKIGFDLFCELFHEFLLMNFFLMNFDFFCELFRELFLIFFFRELFSELFW